MNARYLNEIVEFHTIPLHTIEINEKDSLIEFDDINEERWRIRFKSI